MENERDEYLRHLMETENKHLSKLHKIVKTAIREEKLLALEIRERGREQNLTFGERVADKVALFGGSWGFIIAFLAVIVIWISANVYFLVKGFDPFPFILLNLILSCVAALQAPIIMMSQNRQAAKDRQQAENDYLINLKAELEIRSLHQKMDVAVIDQFKHLCEIQQRQLELLQRIQSMLEKK